MTARAATSPARAAASPVPWRVADGHVLVRVHLTPRASRDGIDGLNTLPDGVALKARVRAVPEDGKANAALAELIADRLEVAKRDVAVVAGHTSRLKTVSVSGDADALLRRLETIAHGG